ncbi:hypothetical protein [Cellulosilyticum ruminicola]|uniref:hypothetical protein n=1 Tax=Cellulosilyticum ruminicola TaxID=425254 RepID=UPI0006D2462E|nr:hypothetical protein [Cellulosilyticum ruminicola]
MKKHLILFLVVFAFLIFPLHAHTTQTITLNNFPYKALHNIQIIDETTYISLDDILRLTYSTSTQNKNDLKINFNGLILNTRLNSRIIQSSMDKYILRKPIIKVDEVIYFPVEFFTVLNYPVTVTDTALAFNSPVPYSTSTDRYKDHIKIAVHDQKLTELVCALTTTSEEGEMVIKNAIKNNHYLVIPYKSPSKDLIQSFNKQIRESLPMEIIIREGDFLDKIPSLAGLKTLPITLELKNDTLTLKLDKTTFSPTCFEIAFNPSAYEDVIDSEKTVDAMLMRLVYHYVRDYYSLKDDLNFSDISTIEIKRSDTMHFNVYSDYILDSAPVHYEMTISKQMHPDRISYVVELIKCEN